jgi:hypothetical protein
MTTGFTCALPPATIYYAFKRYVVGDGGRGEAVMIARIGYVD